MLEPIIQNKIRVKPEGDVNSKLAIIGDVPTKKEYEIGKPFRGYAGDWIEENLKSVGIPRISCYMTLAVKDAIPLKSLGDFSKKYVVETDALRKAREELREEISGTNCNLYMCCGPISFYLMTGIYPILLSKRRGSLYESSLVPGKKVLAILPPISTIRQYINSHYIMFDLVKAKYEREFPEIRLKPRKLILIPDFISAKGFIQEAKDSGEKISFDIEVTNDQTSHISIATNDEVAISIVFIKANREHVFSAEEEYELMMQFAEVLEDPSIDKVLQNALFDIPYLFRHYGIETRGTIWDTMVIQSINYPDFLKGLGFLCSIYTDMAFYKDEGKKNMGKGIQDDNQFAGYSAKDSIVLPEILKQQEQKLVRDSNMEYAVNFLKLIHPLAYMSEHGMLINTEGLKKLFDDSTKKLEAIEAEIIDIVGYDLNIRSSKQTIKHFYVVRNIPPYKSRQTGNPTTDDNALQRIARKYKGKFPEVELLREYRKLAKLKGTYYSMAVDDDKRIRCSWNLGGGFKKGGNKETNARYSRLSSSENIHGTGTNLQNQPPAMKEFFLPDPGHLLVDIDLKQADWRFVAYLSEDPNMIDALVNRKDIHKMAAAPIFGYQPDELHLVSDDADIKKDPSRCASFGNGTHSERFWGKKANHAFNYRQSATAFALQLLIGENEAKTIRAGYFEAFPNIQNVYWAWVEKQLRHDRTITNLFGRSYRFLDRWSTQLVDAATAFYPQSSVADIINQWGINEMWYNPEKYKYVDLLLQVHDSVVIQIPLDKGISHGMKILENLQESLEQPIHLNGFEFFLPAEISAGVTNLKEVKDITQPKELGEGRFEEALKEFY